MRKLFLPICNYGSYESKKKENNPIKYQEKVC